VSYRIYQTEAFVLGSQPAGEANRFLYLFTEELGVIGAVAQGLRLGRSKLRYALPDYAYASISVLRGRNSWRLRSAHSIATVRESFSEAPLELRTFVQILALIKRLVPAEEPDLPLFGLVRASFIFLRDTTLTSEELADAECLVVLRILNVLGYLADRPQFKGLVVGKVFSREALGQVRACRREALFEINQSLEATQL
jgi:DNA repair protein RecO (recombination protein O)